jgi:hypothetical protein
VDLLTAITTCSLHSDFTLVLAIVMTFSHGNPFTVQDASMPAGGQAFGGETIRDDAPLTLVTTQVPKTRADAMVALERITSAGGTPVLGLLPVPPEWAGLFRRKPADLFNSCTNLTIAIAMLSEYEYECGKAGRQCILKRYADAVGMSYFDLDVLREIKLRKIPKEGDVVIDTDAILEAPLFSPGANEAERDWGTDKLYFPDPAGQPVKKPAAAGVKKAVGK